MSSDTETRPMTPEEEAKAKMKAETVAPELGEPSEGVKGQTENPPADKRKPGSFGWRFDNDEDPNRFFIEVPIDAVAADPSINGIIFLLGFFENCKNEAVAQVKRKRMALIKKTNGKLILPG